jgi:predicted ATPase
VDLGPRGERWIDALLAATASDEKLNRQYKGRLKAFSVVIAEWLRDMGLIASFRVDEVASGSGLYRVFVKRDPGSPETLITDVGFGVSQVLPALVLLHYAPEGSIVILEQPEIHLHPAVQAALADVILTTSKNRNIQVVIESHSEHLLHRMLRRVAEGRSLPNTNISEDDVQFYFCHSKDGVSTAEELQVNMFGGISNWPKDFFGDLAGDIYARDKAAMEKKRAMAAE